MTIQKQIHHEMQSGGRTTSGWWHRLGILCLLLAATAITLPAQTFTTLVNFNITNGDYPFGGLVQGPDGDLYGTTAYGGEGTCTFGCGTVFKMSPSGKLTSLHSFTGTDGASLFAGLVLATDGNFYGTTNAGGANNNSSCNGNAGCGTVFKVTPQGALTTLYSFCAQANCADGELPWAALVQAIDGNFYGTTWSGGAYGYGTVFKITRGGTLTTLHSFDNTEGGYPEAGLVQGRDGNFYGTTFIGDTVFKITPQGTLTTLYRFCSQTNCPDGASPAGGLIQATDGDFYGVTYYGGNTACSLGCGTVFKITATGTLTTLHSFVGTDGFTPDAGLTQATDGNLYGTTVEGGYNNMCPGGCGTIFEITPDGTFTNLYTMTAFETAADPRAPLAQDTVGILYGTTSAGGLDGGGVVFSLTIGLGPFVETLPTLGPVGSPVKILGTNLAGATSVSFNGTAATFTVNSTGTAINTTVPSGATTGTVQVVTPGGTLSSNLPFRVRD